MAAAGRPLGVDFWLVRGAFSMCMSHVLQRARMAFSGLWRPHLYLVHGPLVNEYGVRVHGE